MRKYVVLGGLLVFSIALLIFVSFTVQSGSISPQAATVDTRLTLSPPSQAVITNQTFPVDIMLSNPTLQPIGVVDIVNLTYDPTKLQVTTGTTITPGTITQLSNVLVNRVTNVSANQNKIMFSIAMPTGSTTPFSAASGKVATISFKALVPGATPNIVDFNFSTTDPLKKNNAKVINNTSFTSILSSATNGSYTINSPDFDINFNLQFQGVTDPGNYSKTITLLIFAGGTTSWSPATCPSSPCEYRKNNIIVTSVNSTTFTGSVTITAADWNDAVLGPSYDFHIMAPNYLYSGKLNTVLADDMTLTTPTATVLRGGNFLGSDTDLSINTGDGAAITFPTYTTANTILDLNGDGYILGEEYAIMNSNWGQSGS